MYKWKYQNNEMCRNHIHYVLEAMQGLYDSEINISIESFWDGGYVARFGDEMNGYSEEKSCFATIDECMDWLTTKAVELYPESQYAKKFKSGIFFM